MPRDVTIERRREVRRAAERYVRRHYRDPELRLVDVARAVGASPRQLQRQFDGGYGFRAFLLRVRMERARHLLTREHDPLPAYRVPRHVGYSGVSGLRQAFRRFYHCNPSDVQAPGRDYDELWREAEASFRE